MEQFSTPVQDLSCSALPQPVVIFDKSRAERETVSALHADHWLAKPAANNAIKCSFIKATQSTSPRLFLSIMFILLPFRVCGSVVGLRAWPIRCSRM